MRLWHYSLLDNHLLPKSQILSQYRECVCIAKNIKEKGTPNHILVNNVIKYDIKQFHIYCNKVIREMLFRSINITEKSLNKLEDYIDFPLDSELANYDCYANWHDDLYLMQNFYNLQEKFYSKQKDFTDELYNELCSFIRGKDFVIYER